MYEIAVVLSSFFMLVSAIDYVRRAWIRETSPVPATWILMMVMMSLSFFMYWKSPNKSWTANIGVTAGIVNIFIILSGVIAANIRYKTFRIAFDATQKLCLMGGGAIVIFWYFTNQPLISYVLVQCIGLIAYISTVKRLWKAERSTEPLFLWICVLIANLCAIYPAFVKNDTFSWIYLGRAIPSTVLVIYLITLIQNKMKRSITK